MEEIQEESKKLISLSRANKLKPNQYQDGTFTISNLGMFDIREFTAVINPPQSGIMSIGSPFQIKGNKLITVILSYNSEIIDDMEAIKFLSHFKMNVENPQNN